VGQLQHKGSIPTFKINLTLLSQVFLVTGLNKFSENAFREKKSSPKLIIHDNAWRVIYAPSGCVSSSRLIGFYFENVWELDPRGRLGCFLLENKVTLEIDFVVRGPRDEKYAIEVKSGPTSLDALSGLKAFVQKIELTNLA
jgi:predicted AAA+ superfamily ATPase